MIRMVNMMLVEALRTGASDIHFEAMERTSRLRYRIDGALIERPSPPRALHNAIVSRIKIMSDLDIAERRNPQDGRFRVKALKKEVDIRVSILPTVHGEKVVMRTLDKSNLAPSLASQLRRLRLPGHEACHQSATGIILVTGPTGSGRRRRSTPAFKTEHAGCQYCDCQSSNIKSRASTRYTSTNRPALPSLRSCVPSAKTVSCWWRMRQ